MARISISRNSEQLKVLELAAGTVTIGRSADNSLQLDDKTISKHHARIVTYFNANYVEDLSSTNGTYVNGKKIKKQILQPGDILKVGQHQLRIEEDAGGTRTVV